MSQPATPGTAGTRGQRRHQARSASGPRVVSLVPGATEMLLALEAPLTLVGRSHECDFPPGVAEVPALSAPPDLGSSSREIDAAVSAGAAAGALAAARLERLAPDIVIAQDLCGACAPSAAEVAEMCGPGASVLSLSPRRLDEVLDTAVVLGDAIGAPRAGKRLRNALGDRVEAARARREPAPVRVVALEWLAPLYRAGHWIPDQIDAAGGVDLLGLAGEPASPIGLDDIATAAPSVVVAAPCGWGAPEARRHARADGVDTALAGLPTRPEVIFADADAHFSRPGPRLVDGIEWLAGALRSLGARSGERALR